MFIFILLELIAVSWLDLKYRKIKNIWSILNIALAFICFLLFSDLYILGLKSFQYTFVFFLVGFFLFKLRIMGGGDSKFLSTFFLLVPFNLQDKVFFNLLIVTIVIGLVMLIYNTVKNWTKILASIKASDVQGVKSCFGTKFPYAPVILFTWVTIGFSIYWE